MDFSATNISSPKWKFTGNQYHSNAFYSKLGKCGLETKIYRNSVMCNEACIKIGNSCSVDDFTFINGGINTEIGNRVHIAPFTSIVGGGEMYIGSFTGIAAGCRLITGSDECLGIGLTNPCVPKKYRFPKIGKIEVQKHSLIFSNSIIFPGVVIGEGSVVSAGSVVKKSIEPWGIYKMENDNLIRIADRPKENIHNLETKCVEEFGH